MLVRVLHNDGHYDYVKPQLLDRLIEADEIISFYRSNGVVVVGIDNVRSSKQHLYAGCDRRYAS
jgi:hypothetical protein